MRPLYLGPAYPAPAGSRCEVLLVLEGYPPSSPALEAHHEPMLERLAGDSAEGRLRRNDRGGGSSSVLPGRKPTETWETGERKRLLSG